MGSAGHGSILCTLGLGYCNLVELIKEAQKECITPIHSALQHLHTKMITHKEKYTHTLHVS